MGAFDIRSRVDTMAEADEMPYSTDPIIVSVTAEARERRRRGRKR
jgi:hypothetical protein